MKVLLMDVGSTFVKYAVCDDISGEYVLSDKIPFPKPLDEEAFTVDRAEIETVVKAVMAVALENKCQKIFASVQMHGFLLRYKSGEISEYFSWRSGGGDLESRELLDIDFASRGTKLKPNLPIAKLYKNREELDGVEFFTLGSYIAYLLTGNNATHKTDACASGFYTVDGKTDSKTIPGIILPEFMDEVEPCGRYCGMQIYAPVGDHASSVYGSDIGEDTYLFNIGTTSQIAFVGEGNPPSDMWECRPYFESGKTLFTLGNLFYGLYKDTDKYCAEAAKIINSLPKRARILVGGGGASDIMEKLGACVDMPCTSVGCSIGLEGLAKLSKRKKISVGIMLSEVPFANMPLIMKNSGLDFMIVDNEHGAFDYTFLSKLFTVSRLAYFRTVVRIPDNTRAWITKCVDAGADGFLLPMTNRAEDIKKVVEYAKYAPVGKRGISTMRAHTLYAPPALCDYMPLANERIKVYAQIETVSGVENIEEILAIDGVDGVFIGPNDLSCDMGCIGDNGPILAAIDKVSNAAKKANKPFGIITTTKALIDKALACGASMISYGSELNMLKNECNKIKRTLK
ncbi:MAG: hypothetical protein E7598_08720 [Ruminococcaceae bacterium]|nr:hypothetical protein [Oscillospiraceae bacterium]